MANIKFVRNQTNEATEMLLNVDNILTINSSGVTNLVIKTTIYSEDAKTIAYTLQVAGTGGVTLTRPSIVQKVIDTIEKAGTSGPAPIVPDMEVQLVTISSEAL